MGAVKCVHLCACSNEPILEVRTVCEVLPPQWLFNGHLCELEVMIQILRFIVFFCITIATKHNPLCTEYWNVCHKTGINWNVFHCKTLHPFHNTSKRQPKVFTFYQKYIYMCMFLKKMGSPNSALPRSCCFVWPFCYKQNEEYKTRTCYINTIC